MTVWDVMERERAHLDVLACALGLTLEDLLQMGVEAEARREQPAAREPLLLRPCA